MKKYLFLFTISPVQAFISQARKVQDLFAGSQLLTDLTRFAIYEFSSITDDKNEIIFPAKWEKEFDAALPNRFLSEVECNPDDVLAIGKTLEQKVKKYFKQIADGVFAKHAKGQQKPKGFDAQIDNHLIIHWVFEPYDGRSYQETYAAIESNLGSIKNIREFEQLPETEKGRKDNMSGELNALFFNEKFGRKPAFTYDAIQINESSSLLSAGEGLSAVSLTKRFYKYEKPYSFQYEKPYSFPSTAEIAQLDIINDIRNIDNFKHSLFGNFDCQLLYRDNLNEEYFKKNLDFSFNDGIFLEIKKKYNEMQFPKGKKQKKYYTILIFDGDDMGEWLSGSKLGQNENDDVYLKKYHHRFSELLADFAKSAKEYVDKKPYGRTIYAGGDDFLALLNLDNVFDVVADLRNKFNKEVSLALRKEYPEIEDDVNFSAGLTIAHYSHPLGDVLNNARQMEKKAKESNKNSLAISVLKNSGEQQQMVMKWGDNQDNIKAMSYIINALKEKDFSPAFIENLNQVFQVFVGSDNTVDLFDIFKLEAGTFINRAKKPKLEKVKVEALKKNVDKLSALDLKNTLEALNIIDFIYRKA